MDIEMLGQLIPNLGHAIKGPFSRNDGSPMSARRSHKHRKLLFSRRSDFSSLGVQSLWAARSSVIGQTKHRAGGGGEEQLVLGRGQAVGQPGRRTCHRVFSGQDDSRNGGKVRASWYQSLPAKHKTRPSRRLTTTWPLRSTATPQRTGPAGSGCLQSTLPVLISSAASP